MNILIQCQSYAIIMYKDSLNWKHKLILLLIIVLFEYIKLIIIVVFRLKHFLMDLTKQIRIIY